MGDQTEQPTGGGFAVASLVLGIIGLLAWCIPIIGLPINVVGLVLGIDGDATADLLLEEDYRVP